MSDRIDLDYYDRPRLSALQSTISVTDSQRRTDVQLGPRSGAHLTILGECT
jgi:hypothetical protein